MNLRSGWDSARHVRPGILLWRRLYPRKKVQGQRPHPGRMEDGRTIKTEGYPSFRGREDPYEDHRA